MSLPRLLAEAGADPMSHGQHRLVHGEMPGLRGLEDALIAELTRSGLRGRGGGGFPLGRKLEAVRRARGDAVVVVNGCESEPLSVKDRMLLQSLPHLVLDGALCCARALGATEILVALEETSLTAIEAIDLALGERPDMGSRGVPTRIVEVPPGYVTGQETSIVSFLNGGAAKPTHVPPRITERGVTRRPSLMANAETLAHAALIARRGAKWFRQVGTSEEPGSVLLTLSGCVAYPGVYETTQGSSLRNAVASAGGLQEPARAFLIGGYAGNWVDAADARDLRLSRADLRHLGASLGPGVIVALPQSACPVSEVTRVADWMDGQSAGQCGPCTHGLSAISSALSEMAHGTASRDELRDIRRWATLVVGRGACAHPDGLSRFVTSALSVFAEEFQDHAEYGPCDACERRPVLITPRVGSGVR